MPRHRASSNEGFGRAELALIADATRAPLLGREQELRLLESTWAKVLGERRPRLFTIVGPAGIGKSRLAAATSRSLVERGHRIVHGRCSAHPTHAPYAAFAAQVREVAGILDGDRPAIAREKLARIVADLFTEEESREALRCLSLLLGLGLDPPITQRVLLFFTARRFVERLALRQPTLFVFDDVQRAGVAELELLDYLGSRVHGTTAMLLVLARPEVLDARPGWGDDHPSRTLLSLAPLAPADASAIAARVLGDRRASVPRIVDVAQGNPLFLETLAASLGEAPDLDVPPTLPSAISARFALLPEDLRAVLRDASVVGRTFSREDLRRVGTTAALDEALDALTARGLIHRSTSARDGAFDFAHDLVRELAYATLSPSARRACHSALARQIIERDGGSSGERVCRIAHHLREAGDTAEAIHWLLVAAERAREAWGVEEVIDLYGAAAELAEDPPQRKAIRLRRGLALVQLDRYDQGADELGELLPDLDGRDELEALLARACATMWNEQNEEAMNMAERALASAERLGAGELIALATARLSQTLGQRGEDGDLQHALDLGDRALESWVPGTRSAERAESEHLHADAYYWVGRYDKALGLSRAATERTDDPHSTEFLVRSGGLRSLVLTAMGRYEEAIAVSEHMIALSREIGRPIGIPLNYSTMAWRELYETAEARRRSEEALENQTWGASFQGALLDGLQMPRLMSLVDLLVTDLAAGEIAKAEAAWPAVWDRVRRGRSWQRWLLTGRMVTARAELALHTEGPAAAAEWAHKGIAMARSVQRRKYETASRAILGRALIAMGRLTEAAAELRTAVADADGLGSPLGRWQTRAALAPALYALGDDDGAERVFREASAVIRDIAQGLSPARAKRFLDVPPVRDVLARGANDAATS